jgi:hypothetical protein
LDILGAGNGDEYPGRLVRPGLTFGSRRVCLAALAASALFIYTGRARFMVQVKMQSTPTSWHARYGCISSHCKTNVSLSRINRKSVAPDLRPLPNGVVALTATYLLLLAKQGRNYISRSACGGFLLQYISVYNLK